MESGGGGLRNKTKYINHIMKVEKTPRGEKTMERGAYLKRRSEVAKNYDRIMTLSEEEQASALESVNLATLASEGSADPPLDKMDPHAIASWSPCGLGTHEFPVCPTQ